ncbi:hypothetical protein F6532_12605 [Salmonella enterica]|nr:hypothetical protein [Salmonella enterica]
MTNQIAFKSQTLKTVEHDGKIWFTAATLAAALEYSDAKSVSNIYNRNKDEFTPCMTVVVENINSGLANNAEGIKTMTSDKSKGYGNLVTKTRVFFSSRCAPYRDVCQHASSQRVSPLVA